MFQIFDGDRAAPQIPRWLADDIGVSPGTRLRDFPDAARRLPRRHRDPLVQELRQVPLFSSLTPKRRRVVEQLVTPLSIQEQTVVAVEGAPPREFLVVLDGTVAALRDDQFVTAHGPGSSLGAAALLADRPRATSLVTATPLRALVVSRQDFARLLDEVPEVSQRLHAEIGRAALAGIAPELAA
jgi:cAMP-dependent protein kinase regulator